MSRLPDVLSLHDLPMPELRAARLDGEVFGLDGCFCPVDEVEQARHRADAVAALVPARLIAEQRTAAWIWGVTPLPPQVHQLCASVGARTRPSEAVRMVVREVVIDDDDIVLVGAMRVTSVLRTIIDLARFSENFGAEERQVAHGLMQLGGLRFEDCAAEIDSRRNLPNKKRALARIRLAALPLVEPLPPVEPVETPARSGFRQLDQRGIQPLLTR